MKRIRVDNDPFGRSVKRVLEYLQTRLPDPSFSHADLPPLDADCLTEAERELGKFDGSLLSSASEMAATTVLLKLKQVGLIEMTPHGRFRLTQKGCETRIDV